MGIVKKRSSRLLDQIARTSHPELESVHAKAPGLEPADISGTRNPGFVSIDKEKEDAYQDKVDQSRSPGLFSIGQHNKYHTHPNRYWRDEKKPQTYYSFKDIKSVIGGDLDISREAIVQRDKSTGEISGLLYLKGKKESQLYPYQKRNREALKRAPVETESKEDITRNYPYAKPEEISEAGNRTDSIKSSLY